MIVFKQKRDDGYLQMKVSEGITWPELAMKFVDFVQGCGYGVRGSEIGEHLVQEYNFEIEKSKINDNIVLEHEYKPKRRKKRAKK